MQLASTTSQRGRAVLMGLAIETTKKKESGREYESGYLSPRCFDPIKKYLALQDKLDSIRKDLKSKITLRLRIKWTYLCIKWNSSILTLMQSRVIETTTKILPTLVEVIERVG